MILQTQRLILRTFTHNDLNAFALLLADKEVMRFSLSGPLNADKAAEYFQKRILDHYEKYGFGFYAVMHKEDHQLIGFVGLIMQNIDDEEKVELAFRFNPKYWGQGLALEAAKAIAHYAFSELGIAQLISIIDPKNTRSLKLAERLGMYFWKNALFHGFSVGIYALDKLMIESFQEN